MEREALTAITPPLDNRTDLLCAEFLQARGALRGILWEWSGDSSFITNWCWIWGNVKGDLGVWSGERQFFLIGGSVRYERSRTEMS